MKLCEIADALLADSWELAGKPDEMWLAQQQLALLADAARSLRAMTAEQNRNNAAMRNAVEALGLQIVAIRKVLDTLAKADAKDDKPKKG